MKWTTTTMYVDLNTGEVLTNKDATNYYVVGKRKFYNFKTNKHGIKTSCEISIVYRCRRKPRQLNISEHTNQ